VIGAVVIGIVVSVLVLLTVFLKAISPRRNTRRVKTLLSAAAGGDAELLQRTLDKGISIDQSDPQGNTALHHAFYTGQEQAIARLREFGADENLRNNEGLTPPEMADIAEIERLLRLGVFFLTERGAWRNEKRGRAIYDQLTGFRPRVFNPALVRVVLQNKDRRRLLMLAIKIGKHGSEDELAEVLHGFGDQSMAEDYLNAGSPALRETAAKWARLRGLLISYRGGHTHVTWGRF
jgi:hypothetical protein